MKNQVSWTKEERRRRQRILEGKKSALCGAILMLLYALPQEAAGIHTAARRILVWGDGITMTGVLLLLLAGIFKLNRIGMWDWFSYVFYQAKFLVMREKDESYTNFHDFKKLRERSEAPVWPWLTAGCMWLTVGIVLSIWYYGVK